MNNTNSIPKITSIYKSMPDDKKGALRKGFCNEFDIEIQAFDRRRKKEFKNLSPAEKKWMANFLQMPIDELFSLEPAFQNN